MNRAKITGTVIAVYCILSLQAILCLFPLVWTLLSSVKSNTEILVNTMQLPSKLFFQNYADAWENGAMIRFYINTTLVALGATSVNLLISSMATYILTRVKPNLVLYTYFAAGLILPVYVIMLPLFKTTNMIKIGMPLFKLALVYITIIIPQTFFILYGYMKTIPKEMEEAAIIDGCTMPGIFFKIIFPLSKPGLGTVGIFSLLFCWNEYLLPLVLTSGNKNMVLSLAIRQFQASYITNYGGMTARLILSIIPVLILYLLFQNNVVKGLTAGAVKG